LFGATNQNPALNMYNSKQAMLNTTVSSVNTFDLYKLGMSKDMVVLRRQYDRMKHELKVRKERLLTLEKDWDNLHSLNTRDNHFRGGSLTLKDTLALRKSTILTADLGTERKDEHVNLDSLKSHILVQRSKLHHALEKAKEVKMEKLTL
jgi:hypothetical protein